MENNIKNFFLNKKEKCVAPQGPLHLWKIKLDRFKLSYFHFKRAGALLSSWLIFKQQRPRNFLSGEAKAASSSLKHCTGYCSCCLCLS